MNKMKLVGKYTMTKTSSHVRLNSSQLYKSHGVTIIIMLRLICELHCIFHLLRNQIKRTFSPVRNSTKRRHFRKVYENLFLFLENISMAVQLYSAVV